MNNNGNVRVIMRQRPLYDKEIATHKLTLCSVTNASNSIWVIINMSK